MKPMGLLQAELAGILAAVGHTQYIVIGDAGLPIPQGVRCIDLAVRAGLPSFLEVVQTVLPECVFESYIIASEMQEKNPGVLARLRELTGTMSESIVMHEELKRLSQKAQCIVRTGETSPYANIILVGGVNF